MENKVSVAIAVITIVIGILTSMGFFKLYPDFTVTVFSGPSSSGQYESLVLKNTGLIQGKNVLARVSLERAQNVTSTKHCFEGQILNATNITELHVSIHRMSTNVPCEITLTSSIGQDISQVVISADDAPGGNYYRTNYTTSNGSQKETQFLDLVKFFQLALFFSLTLLVAEISYFIFVRYNRRRQYRSSQRQLEIREKELNEELFKLYELLNLNSVSLAQTKDTLMEDFLKEKMSRIQQEISEKEDEKSEVKSKRNVDEKIYERVGRFVSDYANFEQRLRKLAIEAGIPAERTGLPEVADKLRHQNIISPNFMDWFVPVREFRNRITHVPGLIDKTEINQNSRNLKKMSDELKNVRL